MLMTVLVISCHPDDMEIACADTLLKCKERLNAAVKSQISISLSQRENITLFVRTEYHLKLYGFKHIGKNKSASHLHNISRQTTL